MALCVLSYRTSDSSRSYIDDDDDDDDDDYDEEEDDEVLVDLPASPYRYHALPECRSAHCYTYTITSTLNTRSNYATVFNTVFINCWILL